MSGYCHTYYLPLFLRKSSFICIYFRLCLWHLALDTCAGQCIRAFPSINGVTEATQHHLHGYGHPNFSCCTVRFNPCYVNFISGLSFCENQPLIQLADYQALFTPSGEEESH